MIKQVAQKLANWKKICSNPRTTLSCYLCHIFRKMYVNQTYQNAGNGLHVSKGSYS